MKRPFKVTAGITLAALGLLASSTLVGATTKYTVDPIMKNDLKVKTVPSAQLVIGGSSFDGPLVQAAQQQWWLDSAHNKSAIALYSITKSGTGRANVISGAYNIGFSDFPMNQVPGSPDVGPGSPNPTLSLSDFVQVPVVLGGVAIVYHFGVGVPGSVYSCFNSKQPFTLTGLELGEIFAGKISNWDNPAIEHTNAKCTDVGGKDLLPNLPIVVLSRTSGSGTTFGFKDYLSQVDKKDFPAPDANAFPVAPVDYSNSGDLEAAAQITDGAIGYVEYGYAVANSTPTIALVNKSNKIVKLSEAGILEAATVGLEAITKSSCKGFNTTRLACFEINNETGATVYPISLFSYAILDKSQSNKTNGIAEVKFLDFLAHQGGGKSVSTTFGQDLADANGYVPLPLSVQKVARNLLLEVKNGKTVLLNATD